MFCIFHAKLDSHGLRHFTGTSEMLPGHNDTFMGLKAIIILINGSATSTYWLRKVRQEQYLGHIDPDVVKMGRFNPLTNTTSSGKAAFVHNTLWVLFVVSPRSLPLTLKRDTWLEGRTTFAIGLYIQVSRARRVPVPYFC